ncbi:cathepsin L1 [Tetranychus urticae]|nr:cathepsin L1 [Tetranychus urticae]
MFNFISLTLIICLAGLAVAELDVDQVESSWSQFKQKHGKVYASEEEESTRKLIFTRNLNKIVKHNERADSGLETYRKGINQFTDMEFTEIKEKILQTRSSSPVNSPYLHNKKAFQLDELPKSVDWRAKGLVTPVKDQGACGSCWAFASVAGIEGAWAKAKGKLVSLSEQQILDCATKGNYGCRGGFIDNALDYVIEEGGIDTEASYPYEALQGQCWFTFTDVGAKISNFVGIPQNDEDALVSAVALNPVSIGIDAEDDFVAYESGIFTTSTCTTTDINHGVTVVGYDSQNSTDYYIIKNSWGTSWGENGYIRMARGKNLCGVANMAYYPIV